MDPDVLYQQALKGDIAAAKQLWSLAQQGNPIASMAFGLLPDDIQTQAKGEGKAATTPFQAITGPDGAIYAFNRATGIMGKEAIIPASKVKGTEKWEIKTDPATGRLFIIDLADMFPANTKKFITAPASPASALTAEDIKTIQTIDLPDGSKDVYTRVGDEVVKTHVAAGKTPFALGKVQNRNGVEYLEVSEGVFRELPIQYQSGVETINGRQFVRQPNGSLTELGRKETEAGVEVVGGREFIRDTSGNLQPLAPASLPAGVVSRAGREFLQQPSGALQELSARTPNMVMDQIISEAIINGDLDKALAYQDFRDRPTEQDALSYAMQFARSPADQNIISALARGETTVEQRPSTPTRVGPQPDFLISAFNRFNQSLTAGRPPTGQESQFYLGLPQKREEAKLAAQRAADEAKAQRDLEATTQAGLKTAAIFQGFLDKFGADFAALVGAPAGGAPVGGGPAGGGAPVGGAGTAGQTGGFQMTGGVPTGGAPFGSTPGGAGGPGMIAGQQLDPSAAGLFSGNLFGTASPTVVPTGGAYAPALKGYAAGTTFADIEKALGLSPVRPMAEGGIVFGPTNALLGEDGPEAVIPLNNNLPFGLRQLQAGRPITPPRGNLFRAAGLQLPSAQALQNLTPEDLTIFRDLGAQAGIPSGAFEQELRLGIPGGGRARTPMFLPFLARR